VPPTYTGLHLLRQAWRVVRRASSRVSLWSLSGAAAHRAESLAGRVAEHELLRVPLDHKPSVVSGMVSFVGEVHVFQKRAEVAEPKLPD
jgi:hypothetical protein